MQVKAKVDKDVHLLISINADLLKLINHYLSIFINAKYLLI